MPMAIVTVAGKAAPEIGKKRGRVKDTAGIIYQADPATLDAINVGATYELTYKDDEFKGFKFRVIEKSAQLSSHGGIQGSVPQMPPYVPAPSYPTTATQQMGHFAQQGPDYKSEEIACLAIIKCVSPLSVDPVEIAHALKSAAMGLRQFREWQIKKNVETSPQKDEFSDAIPEEFR